MKHTSLIIGTVLLVIAVIIFLFLSFMPIINFDEPKDIVTVKSNGTVYTILPWQPSLAYEWKEKPVSDLSFTIEKRSNRPSPVATKAPGFYLTTITAEKPGVYEYQVSHGFPHESPKDEFTYQKHLRFSDDAEYLNAVLSVGSSRNPNEQEQVFFTNHSLTDDTLYLKTDGAVHLTLPSEWTPVLPNGLRSQKTDENTYVVTANDGGVYLLKAESGSGSQYQKTLVFCNATPLFGYEVVIIKTEDVSGELWYHSVNRIDDEYTEVVSAQASQIPEKRITLNTHGTIQFDFEYAPSLAYRWEAEEQDGLKITETHLYNDKVPKGPAKHIMNVTAERPGVYLFKAVHTVGFDDPSFSKRVYEKWIFFTDESSLMEVSVSVNESREVIQNGIKEVVVREIEEKPLESSNITSTWTPVLP